MKKELYLLLRLYNTAKICYQKCQLFAMTIVATHWCNTKSALKKLITSDSYFRHLYHQWIEVGGILILFLTDHYSFCFFGLLIPMATIIIKDWFTDLKSRHRDI